MDEHDRRRHEAADDRDRQDLDPDRGQRVALKPGAQAWHTDEDPGNRCERQLETRLEQGRRRPREQDQSAQGEEVPAVTRSRHEPGERCERAGDSRADDGRLPADGEHVRCDRADRQELAGDPRNPQQPRQAVDAERDVGDVLAGDGEQVGKTRGTEVLADTVRKSLVLAENDTEDERPLHSAGAAADGLLDSVAQSVTGPGDAVAASDLAPGAAPEDHVDPLACEPGTLVEAVFGTARLGHANDRLQDRAARRRAADRQDEEHTLAERLPSEHAGF